MPRAHSTPGSTCATSCRRCSDMTSISSNAMPSNKCGTIFGARRSSRRRCCLTSHERQVLLDIMIAAEDALTYVRGLTFEAFVASSLVRRGVLHCLAVIGEAAGKVQATKTEVPELPLRKMKNLRNVIIHNYEGVDLATIWEIVTNQLPLIVAALD